MKRAELVRLTGFSDGYISRIAPTIPGAILRGKQYEFDESDEKFQEWLLPVQLKMAANSLRKEGLLKRDRRPRRTHGEIIKAMENVVTSFQAALPVLPKIRVSKKGCQLRERLKWEEFCQFLEFLVAWNRVPSAEELVEVSAKLDFQGQQLFFDYFNAYKKFYEISGGEPLPVADAYYTPGHPPNVS